MKRVVACSVGLLCLSAVSTFADDESAVGVAVAGAAGPPAAVQGVPALDDLLFVGTSQNINVSTGTLNDVFSVDPGTDSSNSLLFGVQVWGATADPANSRVLFTVSSGLTVNGGDNLFELPYAGGLPTLVGQIATAGGLRVDGLAVSCGRLYGYNAAGGVENGFYSIDLTTLAATPIALLPDSISGIDADPDTGAIYGVNDTTGQLVRISSAGQVTNVAPYPVGLVDIDGLAVGGGFAYLVTDEAGAIAVYDLGAGAYVSPLTSPFTAADIFSGAAYAIEATGEIFCDDFSSGDTSAWSATFPLP
jgi:hypothetical protein